jgi:NADH-quinone oxidoreductase subunit E
MNVLTESMRAQIRAEFPKYADLRAVTLPALHIVHDQLRCVPPQAVREIAELLGLHPAEVHDTMTFYGFFREEDNPLGKRRVWICRSLSCALRGGEELLQELEQRLDCKPGRTSSDGSVSLEFAECLGVCEGAPCMLVDDVCYPNLDSQSAMEVLKSLEKGGAGSSKNGSGGGNR